MYENSFQNDPDLTINVVLVDILNFNWSDSLIGVDINEKTNQFASAMQNMKLDFNFDYALAITKYFE